MDGGDRPALLEQSAIGAPRPAAALSRRARTCHDAGRKGRHDQSDFIKNAAACLRFGFRHWNSVTRPASACSAVARRRLTEDHIRLQGDKLLRQHLRPPGRAGLGTKPEPMAIGDAREHGADATLSSLSCEQNSYFGRY